MTLEIDCDTPNEWSVYFDGELVQVCKTLAETCLWISREFHKAAFDEFQDRINRLGADVGSA